MNPVCPTCESPNLTRRRVHRHGSLLVFLGYGLVVPSILVFVLASMGVVGLRPEASRETVAEARRVSDELEAAGVPESIAAEVVGRRPLSEPELAALSGEQRQTVRRMQMSVADDSTRAAMSRFTSGRAFGFVIAAALASAVFGAGLVGKKSVLCCSHCGLSS